MRPDAPEDDRPSPSSIVDEMTRQLRELAATHRQTMEILTRRMDAMERQREVDIAEIRGQIAEVFRLVAQLAARSGGITTDTYQYSRLPVMAGDPLPPHEFRSGCMRGWREDVGKTSGSPGITDFMALVDRA